MEDCEISGDSIEFYFVASEFDTQRRRRVIDKLLQKDPGSDGAAHCVKGRERKWKEGGTVTLHVQWARRISFPAGKDMLRG